MHDVTAKLNTFLSMLEYVYACAQKSVIKESQEECTFIVVYIMNMHAKYVHIIYSGTC